MNTNLSDRALNCDLAVLHSLAHAGWLNTWQLKALCFPGFPMSKVRFRICYLAEAHWIQHVDWRVGRGDGGRIWNITERGLTVLKRLMSISALPGVAEYERPKSSLEREEWLTGLAVRTFVVRLILEARQRPLLANLTLMFPNHGSPVELDALRLLPDAIFTITWRLPYVQSTDWLPWSSSADDRDEANYYPVFIERAGSVATIAHWIDALNLDRQAQSSPCILVLQNEERCTLVQNEFNRLMSNRTLWFTSWSELERGIIQGGWRDATEQPAMLEPEVLT